MKGEKVYGCNRWWGRGSDQDFDFSAATLVHIRKYIKAHGTNGAVQILSAGGADFGADLIRDVNRNEICPIIVDEIEARFFGGASIPFQCSPWHVTTELGDRYNPDEYFSKVPS